MTTTGTLNKTGFIGKYRGKHMRLKNLTQREIKKVCHYDPITGVFVWRVPPHNKSKGDIAGSNADGYIVIRINGTSMLAHRLAFLYMTGAQPPQHTDHINGVTDDNRWENLRAVSPAENLKNQKMRTNNTTGVMGVYWEEGNNKWRARIQVNGSLKHLGRFVSKDQAIMARKEAEVKYGFHPNHGRSA